MLNVNNRKDIKGFEGKYFVDELGRVSNKHKVMKPYTINSGYACIKFFKEGERTTHLVHRLVASTFIPNPEGKEEVNHIDGNKLNNCVLNLEWVTSKENKEHAREEGLWKYNKPTKGIKVGKTSRFRYVNWDSARGKWGAYLRVDGKPKEQKRFDTEEEAARHVNYLIEKYDSHVEPNVID